MRRLKKFKRQLPSDPSRFLIKHFRKISAIFLFAMIAPISLFAGSDPQVEFFSPLGTVKDVRQVTVRFSEAMVPFGDPRGFVEPFDIVGSTRGVGRWADPKNWVYDFNENLSAGAMFQFTLKSNLKTLAGKSLAGTQRFLFSTGGPAIRQTFPYEGSQWVDEDQIFILGLDAEADESSLLDKVYFSVDGIQDRIGLRIIKGKEKEEILKVHRNYRSDKVFSEIMVQAKQKFPQASRVNLVWGQGVKSKNGVATEADQIIHFATRKDFSVEFSCTRENAEANCMPIAEMSLNFSAPIAWSQVKNIEVVANGGMKWKAQRSQEKSEFVNSVFFKPPFPPSKEFQVKLPAGLADDAGRKLVNADKFPLKIQTDDYPPLAKFPSRFGIIEKNADGVLPVTLRNVENPTHANVLTIHAENSANSDWVGKLKGKILKVPPADIGQIRSWLETVNSARRDESVFAKDSDHAATKGFDIPKPNGAHAFEVVGIPLQKAGFYVLEIESQILGASLLGQSRPMYVPTAALVTNLSVHFKWGRENSIAWVTTLDKGEPVKGAQVNVVNCEDTVLWEGETDSNGIAQIGLLPTQDQLPHCNKAGHYGSLSHGLFVTAQAGGDMAFVHSSWKEGIEPWRFQIPTEYYYSRENSTAHTIFDRTLLRAGETIHMKHLIRNKVMAGFAIPPLTGKASELLIRHMGSDQEYKFPLKWDAAGRAESVWDIPKDAKLGFYEVWVDQKHSGEFRVEEFRVPLMKASIQPTATQLVAPAEVTVDLSAQYLAGGGAANLPVKLRHQVTPRYLSSFEGYDDYTFANGTVKSGKEAGDPTRDWSEESDEEGALRSGAAPVAEKIKSVDLNLDPAGTKRVTFNDLPKIQSPMDLLTEMEFKDPNGEMQTVSAHLPLWSADWLIGIAPDSWAMSAETFKFRTAVVNNKGEPIANAPVEVNLYQRKNYSHRQRLIGGFYSYENYTETKKIAKVFSGKTDDKGILICTIKSPVTGNVILEAKTTDPKGVLCAANRDVWVSGKGDWWFEPSDNDRMDVIPEKKRYEPGETAKFQVRMPFREATALVTVEREGVIRSFVQKISGAAPVIKVGVDGSYSPNVYVSVLAVRGRVGDVQPTALVDLGRPAYKLGIAEINVGWREHELKVKVTAKRDSYKVRETARAKVQVKTFDGKLPPPGTEVSLAVVDEGLLELAPNRSWELLEAMMGRRSCAVETATAQMLVVGKRHFGLKALPPGGGGGRQTTRELFDTLLLWKGRVALNSLGEAYVEIPLNDSITSFKIVAVAEGGMGLFGTGSMSIRSSQDLMIFSGIIPLIREGDQFKSNFTLRNASNHPMELAVSGNVSCLKDPLQPITFSLDPGNSKEVGWDLTVPVGTDTIKYEIEAKSKDGAADKIKIAQKVIPAVPVRTYQATLTQLEKESVMTVERPADAIPGRGGVKLLFRTTLLSGMEGIREFMRYYPYSCMEQKVSKAVALRDENLWKQAMNELPAYLDTDGFVKYFPTCNRGSDHLTAYLIAIADEAGWDIPASEKNKMENALIGFVEGRLNIYSVMPTADLSIRKLTALEALSRSGKARAKMLESIAIEPNLWPTSAVIDWMQILQRMADIPNRDASLSESEQIIRSRLNFQGTTMGFSTDRTDFLWWLMVSTDLNAVKVIFPLLKMPAWRVDMPRLMRGAVGRQHRGAWDLTLANAWGVLAMEKFANEFEKDPVQGMSHAALLAETKNLNWSENPKGGDLEFGWPAKKAELTASHTGSGKPWLTYQSLAALPLKEPLSTGYKIKKSIIAVEKKLKDQWSVGDIARVHLDLEAQSDMTWVAVNDPVPAGASILGTGLGRDSQLATQGERQSGYVWPAYEERSFEAYRSYFEYVPKGKWTVEYTVRFNNSGIFQLPQTRVEALYSPEMFGEIPNKNITVTP